MRPTSLRQGQLRLRLQVSEGRQDPDGRTEFQFKAGNLNFKSTIPVAGRPGAKGPVQGHRHDQRQRQLQFLLTVMDGTADKFRLKIWNAAPSSTTT